MVHQRGTQAAVKVDQVNTVQFTEGRVLMRSKWMT
jgi:hypothetical protein